MTPQNQKLVVRSFPKKNVLEIKAKEREVVNRRNIIFYCKYKEAELRYGLKA